MRFPFAAICLLVASFIFFILWATSSILLSETRDAMMPYAMRLSTDNYSNMLNMLPWAFGIICAIFFVAGIIFVFVLDSLSDEPEFYYRR